MPIDYHHASGEMSSIQYPIWCFKRWHSWGEEIKLHHIFSTKKRLFGFRSMAPWQDPLGRVEPPCTDAYGCIYYACTRQRANDCHNQLALQQPRYSNNHLKLQLQIDRCLPCAVKSQRPCALLNFVACDSIWTHFVWSHWKYWKGEHRSSSWHHLKIGNTNLYLSISKSLMEFSFMVCAAIFIKEYNRL